MVGKSWSENEGPEMTSTPTNTEKAVPNVCWACQEPLDERAKRCNRCQSFRGWRRITGPAQLPVLATTLIAILAFGYQVVSDSRKTAQDALAKKDLAIKEMEVTEDELRQARDDPKTQKLKEEITQLNVLLKNTLTRNKELQDALKHTAHTPATLTQQSSPSKAAITLLADEIDVADEWIVQVGIADTREKAMIVATDFLQLVKDARYGRAAEDWERPLLVRNPSQSGQWLIVIDPSSSTSTEERVEYHREMFRYFARKRYQHKLEVILQRAIVFKYSRIRLEKELSQRGGRTTDAPPSS